MLIDSGKERQTKTNSKSQTRYEGKSKINSKSKSNSKGRFMLTQPAVS